MLKQFGRGTCVALLGMASANLAHAGVVVGGAVGKASYTSGDFKDGSATKFHVGYELANAPVFFDLALQKVDDSDIAATNAQVGFDAMQLGAGAQWVNAGGSGVHARVGYFNGELTVSGPFPSEKDKTSGISYGFGATWMFVPKFGLRAEWERFPGMEHSLVEDQDVTVISGGIVFKFGKQ